MSRANTNHDETDDGHQHPLPVLITPERRRVIEQESAHLETIVETFSDELPPEVADELRATQWRLEAGLETTEVGRA